MPPLHNRPHGRRFTSRVGPGVLLLRAGRDESLRCGPVPELPLAVESPTVRHRARTRRNCAGVAETCGWDAQAEATRDGLWRQAVQSRVIADLAVAVEAPAVADSGGRDPAGVVRTAAHECELEPPLHRGRYRPAYRRVIAQLTGTIGTPAVHGPARRETAAVKETRGDGGEGYPRGRLHEDGAGLVSAAIVAELAGGVPSPAISHTSGGREAAAVRRPGAHGGERHAGRRCDQAGSPSVGTRAVAESSELVSTPTIGIAGGRDCAGMLPAGTDSLERHAHRGLYERRGMLIGAAIVANLAATVRAPAVDGTGRRHATGM